MERDRACLLVLANDCAYTDGVDIAVYGVMAPLVALGTLFAVFKGREPEARPIRVRVVRRRDRPQRR
jgi:hypothetical protein